MSFNLDPPSEAHLHLVKNITKLDNNVKDSAENDEQLSKYSKEDQILLQPFHYIIQVPGKRIRSKLTKAFNHWLNIPKDKLLVIEEVVQMLHDASLLIDDIQDNSILRRGIPVAHKIFGIASTINAANYVYFLGLEKVLRLGHPDATTVFTEQLLELHRGQGMEIYWRDSYQCPTEEEYRKTVERKTGGLFGLGVRLMQLFSDNKSDYTELTALVGYFFQVLDDYLNLSSTKYTDNKSYCEDFTEGKFSFPIIHAIQTYPENPQIFSILRQRTTDVGVKKYAVDLLNKLGSFAYTIQTLEKLDQQVREQIEAQGGNPFFVAIMDELKVW